MTNGRRWRIVLILICIQKLNYINTEHGNIIYDIYASQNLTCFRLLLDGKKCCFKVICILLLFLLSFWFWRELLRIESSKWLTASIFCYEAILPKNVLLFCCQYYFYWSVFGWCIQAIRGKMTGAWWWNHRLCICRHLAHEPLVCVILPQYVRYLVFLGPSSCPQRGARWRISKEVDRSLWGHLKNKVHCVWYI